MSKYTDKAANQLVDYKKNNKNASGVTTQAGNPIGQKDASLTVGPRGQILLQDNVLIEELAHFTRERIPERVVHAKGAGAFGYFEVTHDITKYTAAKLFSTIGKKTPLAIRFSTVAGESGSADTVRDPRGFAIKFYTEDGIWDLAGNNTPIFFIRDPILFPHFIHSQKRNPQTHLKDANMFWDFITLRPECTHQTLFVFSDRGIPDGFRFMNGYGSHTYKFINDDGKAFWVKFHHKTNQGIKNLDPKKATEIGGSQPDYALKDLFNAIANGDFPSWTTYVQIMTEEQAKKSPFNPFDLTKIWPQGQYPLIPVGKIVLNRNPENYFTEVEQIAFSPSHLVPGIDSSPDRMLQGRLFAYDDTHRHRLGTNYLQIPVNCPFSTRTYQRDGFHARDQSSGPNYHPNSFNGPTGDKKVESLNPPFNVSGDAYRYNSLDDDDFTQSKVFYQKVLDQGARERLIANIVDALKDAADFLQERAVKMFGQVDATLAQKLTDGLKTQKRANL